MAPSIESYWPAELSASAGAIWIQVYLKGIEVKAGATVTLIDPQGQRFTCCAAAVPIVVPPSLVGIQPKFVTPGLWTITIDSGGKSVSGKLSVGK